jgi:hypothetical protein
VQLDHYDLSTLKLLKIRPNLVSVLLKAGAVVDALMQSNVVYSLDNLLPVSELTVDNESPVILNTQLDMGSGSLFFAFDEPVLQTSIDATKITIQSGPSSPHYVTLTAVASSSIVVFRDTMVIKFNRQDAGLMKLDPVLAKDISTSYVSILFNSLTDMSDNYLNGISFTSPLQVSVYKNDTTAPQLYAFDLDMQLGQLVLYFSEPIVLATFNINYLFIQNRIRLSDGVSYVHSTSHHSNILPSLITYLSY